MVRSFRFTATLTAMQLATSLVRVVLALGEAAQTATRQLDVESKKKGKVRGRPCADFMSLAPQAWLLVLGSKAHANSFAARWWRLCVCKACTMIWQAFACPKALDDKHVNIRSYK